MKRYERAARLAELLRRLPAKLKYNHQLITVEVDKGSVRFLMHYKAVHTITDDDTLVAIEKALDWIADRNESKNWLIPQKK